MSVDEKPRSRRPRGRLGRIARGLLGALWPTQRQILTREGFIYFCVASCSWARACSSRST